MSDSEFAQFMKEMRESIREVKEDVARIRQEVIDIMNGEPKPKRKWWQIF